MKKFLGIFLAALMALTLFVAVSAADVYVSDGGSGDGSSVTAALGDMTAAIEKVANGGTVHIVGTYTCADEYHEPAHKGDIVIEGGRYIFTNGKYNRWFLSGSGSTTFENITFEYGEGSTSLFIAQFNKLILGEGLVFPSGGKCYVVGGYQYLEGDQNEYDLSKDSYVTVKSGNLWCVAGFSRGSGTDQYTGTSHIRVEGGEIATVYGAAINGSYAGNGIIDMTGGSVNNLRAGGDATRRINNCEINISGGMIGTLSVNNVLEKCVVNFTGGAIGSAEKTVSDTVQEFVTDGKAVLNYASNLKVNPIVLMTFDEANVIGGAAAPTPATEAPAKTEETPVDATPVETTGAAETTAAVETTGEDGAEVTETADAAETTAAVEATEAAPAEAEVVETTAAAAETKAVDADAQGSDKAGAPIGLIIGAVVLVAAIAAAVIVLVKKKKK